MAKAFSLTSVSFHRVPNDSELVCLLGDGDPSRPPPYTPIQFTETFSSLTCGPRLIPMKVVVPLIVLAIFGLTCGLAFTIDVPTSVFWLIVAVVWLDVPVAIVGLAWVNRMLARKGDHFQVDLARRTLTLSRIGRTLAAREIVAFTELCRYYRHAHQWVWTQQTGVLVHGPADSVELLPVVREDQWRPRKPHCADRLAEIFGVPVRRVEMNRSQSAALEDC